MPSPTVVVALSGGVDSAVAAALLVEAGARVVGITMRLYDARGTPSSSGGRCCGPRDIEDARRVATHLGIPFYVADYAEEFARAVVDDFVAEYASGRTPNPCVRCNQHIKFTPLVRRAKALGADALATGHYARIVDGAGGRKLLARARDAAKDQSYFLFGMPAESLAYVRFPLGDLTKTEVREHARRLGLPNAAKAESQEICFVPDGDHAGFVARRAGMAAGDIVATDGTALGRHDGVHHFTVGQRRGFGSLPVIAGQAPGPRYVVRIDGASAQVVVGERADLERATFTVDAVQWWAAIEQTETPIDVQVQIRHRHPPQPGRVFPQGGGRARVELARPERAVAPGQAAVFYDDERVVGGGFIT